MEGEILKINTKVKKLAIFALLCAGLTGYATLSTAQMLGRMSPESPKSFAIGKNRIFFETGEIVYEKGAFYGEAPEDENRLKALFQNAPPAGKAARVFWQRAYDYYHTASRGQVPTWQDQRLLSSFDTRFAINASSTIHLLSPRPFLSIKGLIRCK